MIAALEHVVEALRHELQQYGELLAVLDAQHGSLQCHEPWRALTTSAVLDTQCVAVESARRQREETLRKFAWAAGRPEASTFQALHDLVPPQYQALLEALIADVNHAIGEAYGRASANHAILRRALAHTEQLLATISPLVDSALLAGERNSTGAEPSTVTISAAIV